jgi:Zn-dependent protease
MLGWSINLFRVRGIRISLHFTFLLLLAFYCYEGWTSAGLSGMGWSASEFLLIFTSVVLHELGHSFMAMHFGVGVKGILLMPIGGMAQFDSIPKKPIQELLITAAGPAVNFAIVGALWFLVDFPEGWDRGSGALTLADLARFLIRANLILGLFNLYPAFPMDGGRMVRAFLALKLPYLRATYWAVMLARVLTVVGIAASLYWESYMLTALFVFILMAGNAEYRMLKRQEQMETEWREALRRHLESTAAVPQPPILDPRLPEDSAGGA